MKQTKYYEAEGTTKDGEVILEWGECLDNHDYSIQISDLKRKYAKVNVIYKEYSNGSIKEGENLWIYSYPTQI